MKNMKLKNEIIRIADVLEDLTASLDEAKEMVENILEEMEDES